MIKALPQPFLAAWEHTLLEVAGVRLGKNSPQSAREVILQLAKRHKATLEALRETFNQQKAKQAYRLLASPEHLLCYLLAFHLPNAYRLWATLERLEKRLSLRALLKSQEVTHLRLWDLGCGSGAMSQLLTAAYHQEFSDIRSYLYDTSPLLLKTASLFYSHLQLSHVRPYPRKVELAQLNTAPIAHKHELHVVVLGYLWNELSNNPKAQQKIKKLINHLQQSQAPLLLILLEPGQQQASRTVMAMRDQWLAEGLTTIYPCPHDAPCPMLSRPKDWCYSEFPLSAYPSIAREVDAITGVKRTMVAASSVVLGANLPGQFVTKLASVIVGRPKIKPTSKLEKQVSSQEQLLLCTSSESLQTAPSFTGPLKSQQLLRGLKGPFL